MKHTIIQHFIFTIEINYNSILQYWFDEINIKILAANLKNWGGGLLIRRTNFNAGFVKQTLYNIFSYILFNVFD